MSGVVNLVYIFSMRAVVRFQKEFATVYAGPALHIVLSSYCILQEWDHDDLSAPYWRLYVNDLAGASICSRGNRIELRPDRLILIPPGTPFSTETRRPVGHLHIHFMTAALPKAKLRAPIVHKPSLDQRHLISRLRAAFTTRRGSAFWSAALISHALTGSVLADIADELFEMQAVDVDMSRLLNMMHEQPALFDLKSFGDTASLSSNTLLRRFRRLTGTTPHRYRCRLLIDDAAIALAETSDSIEQIARQHGFCDRYHFSKAFKRHLGISPATYRMRIRKEWTDDS